MKWARKYDCTYFKVKVIKQIGKISYGLGNKSIYLCPLSSNRTFIIVGVIHATMNNILSGLLTSFPFQRVTIKKYIFLETLFQKKWRWKVHREFQERFQSCEHGY